MTTPPTTFGQRAAEYLGYLLATHPRLRRFLTFWLATHILGTWSVAAAPPAAASTLAGALNWTGLADSHGVPVGNYYLSVVSTTEAITKAGPGLSADPSSWARWLANALTTGLTHESIVELLQFEAAVYIFMITMALWLMRFAMSNTWLYWLATWFRPLFETIRNILADLWVFPICLLLGLGLGAYHILWHARKGYGSGIMLSTFVVGILGNALNPRPAHRPLQRKRSPHPGPQPRLHHRPSSTQQRRHRHRRRPTPNYSTSPGSSPTPPCACPCN